MAPVYYRLVPARVRYSEFWRGTRSLLEFILVAIVKTLRIPLGRTLGYADGPFERLEWETLGEHARASLAPDRELWEALGLRYCFCYRYPRIGPHEVCTLAMLSENETITLRVLFERQVVSNTATVVKTTYLTTRLSNGQVLVTCDRADVFPREFEVEVLRRRPEIALLQRHRERIAAALPAGAAILATDAQLEREIVELNRTVFQYAVRRGVLVPMSAEELRRAHEISLPQEDASVTVAELADSPGGDAKPQAAVLVENLQVADDAPRSRHPGVVAETEKIQNKKASWLSGILVLAVSVLLFVGIGGLTWDWKIVLLLIPILLFHELGHFVAMRLFQYRNVRMFFIPLFGAAVTGQNYNVPGWKKTIVSLAGPAPGIVLGAVLGIAALLAGDRSLLLEAAALTVFLNALNLLPFLPLDGGWIMHALVFSRHYWLDVGFRLVAALILLAAGLTGLKILPILGVFMLLGLPAAYRVARIASELRGAGLAARSQDGVSIPPETVDMIVDRIDASFPAPLPDKLKAQYTLQVFEGVNARPPGVPATLALGGFYATSFAAGVAFFAFFTIARVADLGELAWQAATAPAGRYEAGTTENWPEQPAAGIVPAATVIATFADRETAVETFADAKQNIPDGARLTLFGQSVLVGLNEEHAEFHEAVFQRFQAASASVIEANAEQPVFFTLDCIAPTLSESEDLQKEFYVRFVATADDGEVDSSLPAVGYVERNGLYLRIYAQLIHPAEGVPALVEWLCENNCVDVKYGFEPLPQ